MVLFFVLKPLQAWCELTFGRKCKIIGGVQFQGLLSHVCLKTIFLVPPPKMRKTGVPSNHFSQGAISFVKICLREFSKSMLDIGKASRKHLAVFFLPRYEFRGIVNPWSCRRSCRWSCRLRLKLPLIGSGSEVYLRSNSTFQVMFQFSPCSSWIISNHDQELHKMVWVCVWARNNNMSETLLLDFDP